MLTGLCPASWSEASVECHDAPTVESKHGLIWTSPHARGQPPRPLALELVSDKPPSEDDKNGGDGPDPNMDQQLWLETEKPALEEAADHPRRDDHRHRKEVGG